MPVTNKTGKPLHPNDPFFSGPAITLGQKRPSSLKTRHFDITRTPRNWFKLKLGKFLKIRGKGYFSEMDGKYELL